MALRQRHDAERQRDPVAHRGAGRSAIERAGAAQPDQFRRAAADVEQDRALGRRIEQRGAAACGERRLGAAVHDLELETSFTPDASEEFLAVYGGAAGFGGDQARARYALLLELAGADAQRPDGAIHRRIREFTRARKPLAQPYDARERVDHAEGLTGRLRHQQTAIIGAEIERGKKPAASAMAARRAMVRMFAPAPMAPAPARRSARRGHARARLVRHDGPFPRGRSQRLDGVRGNPLFLSCP
jgi:hypothetical protein